MPRSKEYGVASILPFVRKLGVVFDDRATAAIGAAFDAARKDLHDIGQPDIVYEVLANRIVDAAHNGELNPARLCEIALTAFNAQQRAEATRGRNERPR
jgi:hypothetical protein